MVLVSGDADHAPAADGVRALGKQVYVASWGGHGLSHRLRQLAYDHIDLVEGVEHFRRDVQGAEPGEDGPSEAEDGQRVFLRELSRAELKFENGYVGANYFVTRWDAADLDSDPHVRRRMLDTLEKEGRVEIYSAPDGSKAIRTKK